MPDASGKVMDMVRDELQKNPAIKTDELYDKAKKLDKSVSGLTIRQFHARYPLQIKRKAAAARPRRRGAARGRRKKVDRDAVRTAMLGFAKDVRAADGAQVVEVIGGIDKYVEKVLKAAGVA